MTSEKEKGVITKKHFSFSHILRVPYHHRPHLPCSAVHTCGYSTHIIHLYKRVSSSLCRDGMDAA